MPSILIVYYYIGLAEEVLILLFSDFDFLTISFLTLGVSGFFRDMIGVLLLIYFELVRV